MNQVICPLCLQKNSCNVNAKQGCWCNKVVIPQALLDLIDKKVKSQQCICNVCISRFINDPKGYRDFYLSQES